MQKGGVRQVYENYIREENHVTFKSRVASWICAHGRKPEVNTNKMLVDL